MAESDCPTCVEDLQGDDRWLSMHNRFVSQAKEMEPDVLFVGDSLIANLQLTDLWEKWFAPMHSLNFGVGADETQNVLWRINNGELEFIKPKIIVLLVGTNNHRHTAAEVAKGIIAICNAIREKQSQAHILLLTLLPRGQKPNALREKNAEVNSIIQSQAEMMSKCTVIKINNDLIQSDGTIDHRDMWDYLHLTWQGYHKCFLPVYEALTNLLLEEEEQHSSLYNEVVGAASTLE